MKMFNFKYFLFYTFMCHVAPFHIYPKRCFVPDKNNCPIWNCKYHYKNNKYDVCQKEEL